MEPGESPVEALGAKCSKKFRCPEPRTASVYARTVPVSISRRPHKKGFSGQAHHYFLLHLRGSKNLVNVTGPNAEFRSARWIRPEEFNLAWLPPMKRRAYRRVAPRFFRRDGEKACEFRLTRAIPEGMNRADFIVPLPMLTIGSFAIAIFAVLGGVFWACLNDRDRT
jgi:hypothetical protein